MAAKKKMAIVAVNQVIEPKHQTHCTCSEWAVDAKNEQLMKRTIF